MGPLYIKIQKHLYEKVTIFPAGSECNIVMVVVIRYCIFGSKFKFVDLMFALVYIDRPILIHIDPNTYFDDVGL